LPSSSGANIAGMTGGEATPGVNTMGMAGNATDVNQASGSLLNQQGSSLMNPNGQIGMANPTGAATSGTGFTNATPESVNLAANTSTPVLAEDNPSITSQLGTGLMRALPGIVGHFANQGPDMSQLQAQLDAQNALTKQAFDMNVANTNAKSAIGDKLAVNAQSMDPNYYGLQAETAAKNADANAWADQEAKMRAAGYDDNYINSQRQKFALGASQNAGTAYDTGAQRGLQAQNATYGTAGSMYNTGLSGPSSNAADYLQLAKKGTTDATAAGAVVENIFSPVQKNNKTGLDAGVTA
jgi:hypothetical protein